MHGRDQLLAEAFTQRMMALGSPERARGAAAYMKTKDPFFGVGAQPLRAVIRDLVKGHAPQDQAEYRAQILALWALPEREAKYAAIEWARNFKAFITLDALPLYERLVREGQWWDMVDAIAAHLIGPLLLNHRRTMKPVMEHWIRDDNLWIRRTALLAHLKHKGATDPKQLLEHCLRVASEKEFFIRKAIGWALREYSKTAPEVVRAFLETHRGDLSGLSYREGSKRLPLN